jgi:membrane protein YdbS with pleckstrin-like domain
VRALRKLVLGETWALPIGVALTLAAGLVLDAVAGAEQWWRHGGGFVLLVLVVAALWAALPRRRRVRGRGAPPS